MMRGPVSAWVRVCFFSLVVIMLCVPYTMWGDDADATEMLACVADVHIATAIHATVVGMARPHDSWEIHTVALVIDDSDTDATIGVLGPAGHGRDADADVARNILRILWVDHLVTLNPPVGNGKPLRLLPTLYGSLHESESNTITLEEDREASRALGATAMQQHRVVLRVGRHSPLLHAMNMDTTVDAWVALSEKVTPRTTTKVVGRAIPTDGTNYGPAMGITGAAMFLTATSIRARIDNVDNMSSRMGMIRTLHWVLFVAATATPLLRDFVVNFEYIDSESIAPMLVAALAATVFANSAFWAIRRVTTRERYAWLALSYYIVVFLLRTGLHDGAGRDGHGTSMATEMSTGDFIAAAALQQALTVGTVAILFTYVAHRMERVCNSTVVERMACIAVTIITIMCILPHTIRVTRSLWVGDGEGAMIASFCGSRQVVRDLHWSDPNSIGALRVVSAIAVYTIAFLSRSIAWVAKELYLETNDH